MSSYLIAAFYKFVTLEDFKDLKDPLLKKCRELGIKGTILLAKEGINSTIAGSHEGVRAILTYLRSDPRLKDLEHKESHASTMPFFRMKVRLKKEIVTLGVPGIDPNEKVGTYIAPKDWNTLIQDPEIVLIDVRNDYECRIGTFKGAINPQTQTFREFPEFVERTLDPAKNKKIAMMCTGGIRCEKASSFMLEKGFKEVYHLEGGILKYLETTPKEESLWDGECFVFDHRTAVKHGVEEGDYETCYGCRAPISAEDKVSAHYKEGVHCPHCFDHADEKHFFRAESRHKQILLAKKRNQIHLGEDSRKESIVR